MKIGVAGAGAVGGYFGGMLANAGHEVIFLARGQHLQSMKENGMRIETSEGNFNVKGTFSDDVRDFRKVDLVLFCVKSTGTSSVAKQLKFVLSETANLLVMQNGVDNEETLSDIFGRERVLSTATYVSASVKEPGVISQFGSPRLPIGSLTHASEEAAKEVVDAFNHAGVKSWFSSDIMTAKWKKLLWNITFNPLSAVVNADVGQILDDPLLRQTAETALRETCLVAEAKDINVDSEVIEQILESAEKRARNHKTSMLQDRLQGKRMEVESICGYLVREGDKLGVETPVLQSIYSILSFMDRQENT
ncbi:ketopantoate reductase family protein [Pseudalkalibacillus decolorationis]|uniref:ketopantoate reductase family protein n=1 Tax=Pseudalkalibacillus decolorationis TaxID=163879 RepID=UPI002148F813|nr:2-dehydropantoate 2-reductase [Pseudalkalibacillus decolorationis]